jgi:hypothetical protein
MKQIVTLLTVGALCLFTKKSLAQYSENFESTINSLTGNCWQFVQINHNSDGVVTPITGTGSLYSQPPTNGSSTRDISTPYLNIPTSLQVSFSYKLSSALNGHATRTIEIGLLNNSGNFTSLYTISLDKNSSATTQSYNNTFTLASISVQRITFRLGGSTGDGNSRLLFDDLYTNASSYYGPTSTCNSAPVAINDSYSGITGNQVTGNVIINDNDPNGEFITSAIVATSPDGTVVLNQDGIFIFTPNPGFTGSNTTFTYQLADSGYNPMKSNTATVTINFVDGIILPIKLISLHGNVNNNRVSLKWDVAENKNVQRFEVEKSFNGKDFTVAGVVPATGRSGKESYSFDNEVNSNSKVIYRLKIFDYNNNIEVSRVLLFHLENVDKIIIANNTVNNTITIRCQSANSASACINVYDIAGRIHVNSKINIYQGVNVINLPLMPTMKNGIYIVNVKDGTQRHILKSASFLKE